MSTNGAVSRQAQVSTLQFVLWEHEPEHDGDTRQTNAVGLYDLAPRFVFASGERGNDERRDVTHMDSVTRSFVYNGEPYVITLDPARIKRRVRVSPGGDGEGAKYKVMRVEALPGEREQLVEEVIRRLATERARLVLVDGDSPRNAKVQMRFSFYEIQKELARVRRTLSISEIKEALLILSKTFLTIEQPADQAGGNATLLQSTAFPVVAMRGKGGAVQLDEGDDVNGNTETYLEFNPLVAKAILTLKFQSISYEMLMKIRNPVSWWLYKSLSLHYHHSGGQDPLMIRASDIITNSGMNRSKRHRDTLRAIKVAIEVLVTQGVLADYKKDPERGSGAEIVDVLYALCPSDQFLEQIRRGKAIAEQNARALRRLALPEELDDKGRPRRPMIVDRMDAYTIRRERRALPASAETKTGNRP